MALGAECDKFRARLLREREQRRRRVATHGDRLDGDVGWRIELLAHLIEQRWQRATIVRVPRLPIGRWVFEARTDMHQRDVAFTAHHLNHQT